MDMHTALLLTTLAGLSTGLGGLVVWMVRAPGPRVMAFSQGFAPSLPSKDFSDFGNKSTHGFAVCAFFVSNYFGNVCISSKKCSRIGWRDRV